MKTPAYTNRTPFRVPRFPIWRWPQNHPSGLPVAPKTEYYKTPVPLYKRVAPGLFVFGGV